MSQKIKTAVIPAGGFGTRFLPASKSVPKEMFPLGDKPIIYHVVEEAVNSGIEHIIFIVSPQKHAVEQFFGEDIIYEDYLLSHGKLEQVGELRGIASLAKFSFVYTAEPYGNGGALLSCQHLLRDEPFVLVWSDEVMLTQKKPRILQCIEAYEKIQKPVISAVKIPKKADRCKYGMADLKSVPGMPGLKEIIKIVEKPAVGQEPSAYAAHGCYVLPPDIFDAFDSTFLGKNGELWLTDLINTMKKKTGLYAKIIEDVKYLDCGNPLSYITSQVEYMLSQKKYAKNLKAYLKKRLS